MRTLIWHGCYDDGWRGLITPDSFAHPAKMAHGLLRRILAHGVERGYWRAGDLIGDCFGGIGTTGILCAYAGLRSVSVELEPKFVAMAQANFELHRRKWERLGAPMPLLLQGDSRRFAEIVGQAAAVVTSPPYAGLNAVDLPRGRNGAASGGIGTQFRLGNRLKGASRKANGEYAEGYGSAPGQIGALPAGGVDAVISSPPYAESLHTNESPEADCQRLQSKGLLGTRNRIGEASKIGNQGYGSTPGNIGSLHAGEVDAVVTSPPWENQEPSHAQKYTPSKKRALVEIGARGGTKFLDKEYGASFGQIGNESSDTYWKSMAQVYAQVLLALRPGGVAAIVLKDYVAKGKRVPLADDTLRLLLHLGFDPVERIRAMLVKETRTPALFGGEHVSKKERKSFFRRLAEKRGSPRIDHEDVLVVRKPKESPCPR